MWINSWHDLTADAYKYATKNPMLNKCSALQDDTSIMTMIHLKGYKINSCSREEYHKKNSCLFFNRFVSIFFSVCLWVPEPLRVSFSPVTGHWGEEQKGWTILETPNIIHTRCSLAGRLTFDTWGLEGELRDPSALDQSPWSLLGLTGESYSCLSELPGESKRRPSCCSK